MFLSFCLDGWSVPRRALGKYEVLTLPTASGRSDQSHRLAPMVWSDVPRKQNLCTQCSREDCEPTLIGRTWFWGKEACDGWKQPAFPAYIWATSCQWHFCLWDVSESQECKREQFLLSSLTPQELRLDRSWCSVWMCSSFDIGANHVHSTRSRSRLACDSLRSKNARGWSQSKTNSHGQPKLLAFCNTRNWDKCTWEDCDSRYIPHQMNLRNLQGNSAASTALRAFYSTYEKAATPRESPL